MTATIYPHPAELGDILVVGPDSITWQRTSDVRLQFVMIYALLLQVAHPTVGAGVHDYSDFELRPWTRLLRTIDYVTLLVYGGEQAVGAGRRLRELHRGFRGTREDGRRYHALEPDAYAWVHATLIEAFVTGHATFGSRLSAEETDRFYGEFRRLGRLVGVRERDLPPTWREFRVYFERMTAEELIRTDAVARVLAALRFIPPPPAAIPRGLWGAVRIPIGGALRLGAAGPMTPALRARLGINWSRLDEARFRALSGVSRGLTPVLPGSLKVTGPDQLRLRQAAIDRGPLGRATAGEGACGIER
jgi:uncharacterized protein (DUF2236 family)